MRKMIMALAAVFLFSTMAITEAAALPSQEEPAHNGYLVRLRDDAPVMITMSDDNMERISGIEGLYWVETEADAQAFMDMGLADYVEPNIILEELDTDVTPNDTLYSQQWTLSTIDYPEFYTLGYDGTEVTVAVIDSGLYIYHEDIEDANISSLSKNFLGDGTDTKTSSTLYYRDQSGHGTFVASQIAATTNNGVGMAGIASNVELMILRCISKSSSTEFTYNNAYDSNSGSVAVVAEAIIYAADNGADVINLSLGTSTNSQTLANAVSYAQSKGVIIVAAVGNNYNTTLYYPAAYDGVIGVGSVSQSGDTLVKSSFSQYNTSVDVTAPGDDVVGLYVNTTSATTNQYATGDGTSYSAPVVAAVIAAGMEKFSELTTETALSLLAVTSTDYGTTGWDSSFGYGVINATAFMNAISDDYGITYELNDGVNDVDAPTTYKMTTATTLPIPTRSGYSFDGWYTDENFSGDAVTVQEVGTLGALETVEVDGVQSYAIADITYYAKWVAESLTTPTSVTVSGFEATAGDDNTYTVTVPKDTVASVDIQVPTGSSVTTTTTNNGWTFTVTAGNSATADYTITVTYSDNKVPTLTEGTASTLTGNANLASLDTKIAIQSYEIDISTWFSDVTTYTTTCDGAGTATIAEGKLTYTPAETDQVGQAVTITVAGANAHFTSSDVVTITITIGRSASTSTISPTTSSYDIYTGGALAVAVQLYSNTFTSLTCSDATLTESDYVTALPTGDDLSDIMTITLQESWLQDLTTGEHIVTFEFSAGSDATLTITVTDTAPLYDVTYYLNVGDTDAYTTVEDIRSGDTLGSLPTSPTKSGYTFVGWYLADGTTRITASTTVTSDLLVYASWSEVTSSTGGGTISGGSSSGGSTSSGSDSGTSDDSGDTAEDVIEDVEETENVTEEIDDDLTDEVEDESDIILEELTVSFTDTSTEDWFYEDVAFVVALNIMNGVGDGSFAPYTTATRGMITTMLHRMEGEPSITSANAFTDVVSGSYYETATIWSQENGIVSGYSDETFAPDDAITREQLATILYRYAQYKGYDTSIVGDLSELDDQDAISDYATTATAWAYGVGLLTGKGEGILDPTGTALRCEIAAILHRFAEAFQS